MNKMSNISDKINVKTIKHQYGTTVWITPEGYTPKQNETHKFYYTDAPWCVMVTKGGISFEDDSRINPTDFRMKQFIAAVEIANEIWLDEFFNESA